MAERRSASKKHNAFGNGVDDVAISRGFTTKDFTALRAYVQRIQPAVIARTYYARTRIRLRRHPPRWNDT